MRDIKIATVVLPSSIGQLQANLDRMSHWITAAKSQRVEIVCFPELNLSGYAPANNKNGAALTIPGPVTDRLLQKAHDNDLVILTGLVEKTADQKRYATHIAVCPDGRLESYRKIHIAPPEKKVFTPGNRITVFEAKDLKIGIQLCYDAHFPELTTQMALKGADVIFMPHASPRGTPEEKFHSWCRHLTARAYDNGLFIVACNQSGTNERGMRFPGLALVIDPTGEVMAKRMDGKEGLLVATLKAEALAHVRKHRMRYFLPNRRPDIYGSGL
jgi:N-carbamoylputrescine amidase